MDFDNQADPSVLDQLDEVEVVSVRTAKRKASDDDNTEDSKSARKFSKKH